MGNQPSAARSLPVAVGPELTASQRARYARHLLLGEVGEVGQRRLLASRVVVVGAGGLGAPVLAYLVAAGVGQVSVIDDDDVEVSNLQRQTLFSTADVGRPKVAVATERLAALNPEVRLVGIGRRLSSANVDGLLAGHDLVIDGTDNFATRYVVADACERAGVPEVFGSVLQFDASVAVFWAGRGPTYRDVFAEAPPMGSVPSCAEAGVLGAVCGVIGSVMAAEAIKVLLGVGAPLVGRLLMLDALSMTWRTIELGGGVADPGRAEGSGSSVGLASAGATAGAPVGVGGASWVAPDLVDPREVAALVAAGFQLLDVRTAREAAQLRIPGAVQIEVDDLPSGAAGLDRSRPVLVYCRSGSRSRRAAQVLRTDGFAEVREVAGGVLAWAELVAGEQ